MCIVLKGCFPLQAEALKTELPGTPSVEMPMERDSKRRELVKCDAKIVQLLLLFSSTQC